MRTTRGIAISLLLAALCAPRGATASTWLRPLLLKRSTYSESYTFVADLDDGGYVQLTLSATNLGPGSMKSICRAVVVPAQGGAWKASAREGRDAIRWADGDVERLTVGACSAWTGGGASGVEAKLEGGVVRLSFGAPLKAQSPREALVRVGDDRYQSEVLLYRAPVTARLALPGQAPRETGGGGYVDHSRCTVPPKQLAQRWIRFRALRGQRGLLLLGREAPDGSFAPLWACADAGCRDYASFRIERQGDDPAPSFRVQVGDAGPALQSGRLLYRDAPLEDLGLLGKMIAPLAGTSVTYVYRGRAAGGGTSPVDGVLEVEQAD